MEEERIKENEEYLMKHHIFELFEDLLTSVTYKRPSNIREFLIRELQIRKKHGKIIMPIFNEAEIENIFKLYNVENKKTINRIKAKQALKYMANTKNDFNLIYEFEDMPEQVDLDTFKKLAEIVLGVLY